MTESEGRASRPPSIFALAAITALAPFTLNVVVPSVPGLAGFFAVDYATANLTVTMFIVAMALGQLVIGPLSDALGRQPTLLGGMVVFLAGTILCANAWSIESLIVGRFIQAAGGVAGVVLGRAMIRDIYARDQSASMLGYLAMAMVVAPMVAPAIGGILDEQIGWRSIFWVLVAIGIAGIVFIKTRFSETNLGERQSPRVSALVGNFVILLGLRAFIGFTLTMSFASSLFFTFLASAPFVSIEVLGHSASEYGIGFISISLGYMIGSFTSARLAPRLGATRMIPIGCAIGALGTLIMGAVVFTDSLNIFTLFLPMMVITYSNGLVMPGILASVMSLRPELAGSAAGLSGFFGYAFGAVATYIAALLQDGTAVPMVGQLVAGSLLAIGAFILATTGPAARR